MSFDWSLGDMVSVVDVLMNIGKALRESGGAASDYQDTSLFLGGLGETLERLRTCIEDHAASQGGLESMKVEVSVVLEAVKSFKAKIDGKFAAALGANTEGCWILTGRRRVEYALFVSKEAQSLQDKIAVPLSSIQMSLGIQTYGAVSSLISETRRIRIEERSDGIETRRVVSDIISHGIETVRSAVESRVIQSNLLKASDEEFRMKELLQKVGAWLNPVPSADDFEGFMRRLHPRTCEWIFDKPDFSRWMGNETDAISPPLFWISGIPGAGKSYLATRIIRKLRDLYPLAYFYCDSKNEQKCSVLNILRTWAWQLLKESPGCLDKIAEIYFEGAPPSIASMRKALKILSERESDCRVIYVLDGLDECDPNARSELFSILPEILSHTRVLIVSRHLRDISLGISRCGRNKGFASLEISEADNGNDIMDYIQNAVADIDLGDEALVQTILSTLQENAKGMFLWTRLMIEYLSEPGRSIEESERALMDLPRGLDELYGQVLDNLHSNSVTRERSQQLFQWLACALRPLKVGELKVALAIVLDEEHFQTKKLVPKFEDCLRQCCGTLVDISAADRTVSLIHSSVKDFLLRTPAGKPTYSSLLVDSAIAHVYIARASLTYLCFNEISVVGVSEDLELSLKRLDAHFGKWEFLNYATLNWYKHLSIVRSTMECTNSPDKAIHSFRRLYSSQYNTVKWLQLIQSLEGDRKIREESISRFEAVHFFESIDSARLGPEHNTIFEQWLEHLHGRPTRLLSRLDRFINVSPFHYSPVSHISAVFDFDTVTKELIREGGFLRLRDHVGNTPLHEAARANAVKVTKLLLAVGDTGLVHLRDDGGNTPLHEAARANAVEVTKLLLAVGDTSLVHLRDNEGSTPLHEAARADAVEVTEILLAGGDIGLVHLRDNEGKTPLHEAARADAVQVTKLLLAVGDTSLVHLRDEHGNTPLHEAARADALEVTESLLGAGASISAQNLEGASPFELARRYGRLRVASLLIESGALHEYERRDRDIDTPLTYACEIVPENDIQLRLVTLMLDHGATKMINWGGGYLGLSPVGHAAIRNSIRLLKILLEYGADVDAGPANGIDETLKLDTPLVKACEKKGCHAIPVLIQARANVHARALDGRTSLHNTARVNNYDAARMLLDHGADVNAVAGCDGSLPIHDAVRENHIAQVELLLKHNSKLEIEDASGRTPLDIAFDNNFTEAITLLMEAGANASRKGRVVDVNDRQLKVAMGPQKRQPETPHVDIFHVYLILTQELERPLPPSVVTRLTSLTEYWLKSDISRSDYIKVAERFVGPVYLKSSPIEGNVQQVVFTFKNNDQGWSYSHTDEGTSDNSWTWFEVESFDAEGRPVDVDEDERRLHVNVHGSKIRRQIVVVGGRGEHMRQAKWLEQLRRGHSVGIVPDFEGWMNHVHAVRVEIYCTGLWPFHEVVGASVPKYCLSGPHTFKNFVASPLTSHTSRGAAKHSPYQLVGYGRLKALLSSTGPRHPNQAGS